MKRNILLISDIHGNFPALSAIESHFQGTTFDRVINCGDSTVYAPFPNETLDWLQKMDAISILGNTDKKVIKLLKGKSFKKPGKPEKRLMYETTAKTLTKNNCTYLMQLPKKSICKLDNGVRIGIYHGSPADHHEFLFSTTHDNRFLELAATAEVDIVVTGHSHTPYYKFLGGVHFINPGSVGRMFDGNPDCSCAVLQQGKSSIRVHHFRLPYNIQELTDRISAERLPEIYSTMYQQGRKLN